MERKSFFRLAILMFGLVSFLFGCSKKESKLITIDEFLYSGFKINYFIGIDSTEIFKLIEKNRMDFRPPVDSAYVFVVKKNEFKSLLELAKPDKNEGEINGDSIALAMPRMINVTSYNDDTLVERIYFDNTFTPSFNEVWKRIDNPSPEAKRLVKMLRKHYFLKD